ncbi:MmcQ/YjbR family DNA-binding protein [Corynebacterium suedekumii]|nr:MmcQ/YjbR family DNA-binding protein [Corynebacterium suedekumii]
MLTRGVVTLKADPFEAEMLRHTHAWITPGWHMNKRHWISVADGVLNAKEPVTSSWRIWSPTPICSSSPGCHGRSGRWTRRRSAGANFPPTPRFFFWRPGVCFRKIGTRMTPTAMMSESQPRPAVRPARTAIGARMVMPISKGAKPT